MTNRPVESELSARVLAVRGVTDLFPPSHGVARRRSAAVGVTEHPTRVGGTSLTARIGVTAARPAPETAREVADMLRAVAPDATVTVQITRIA